MTPPARTVAYLGGRGSFSEEACRRFFGAHELMPMADFAAVAQAVRQGSADLAVLPISNSRVGPIAAVRQLLHHPELRVIGEEVLGIRLNLLGVPGTDIDTVREVLSHPAALVQCQSYLGARHWTIRPTISTADAARQVAAAKDKALAAIGSDEAAAIYGLAPLDHDLQGAGDNFTRFAVVERRDQFA